MGITEFMSRWKKRNQILNNMDDERRAVKKLDDRNTSAEERALNKYLEQQRQEKIKEALVKINKHEQDKFWHKDVITQPDLFKEKGTLLQQKNLFTDNKNLFKKEKKLYYVK